MGATQFEVKIKGTTAKKAFQKAMKAAQYEHGHAGYTGTIAEKNGFVEFRVPHGMSVERFVNLISSYDSLDAQDLSDGTRALIERAREVYDDKWGPAVAVELEPDEWLFCGLASI
jgi:hypothetical protein